MAGLMPSGGNRLTPAWIETVRQASDIVTIVGEKVRLKRSGQGFVGLCPFHQERTPSFHVHPQRQFFHCFGCGVGGDVFAYVMRMEGLTFPEAARWLARRAGIAEPTAPDGSVAPGAAAHEEWVRSLWAVQEWAVRWFERTLYGPAGTAARTYLQRRGVRPQTAALFHLGYAPAAWDALVNQARRDGVALPLLGTLGLAVCGKDGRWWDRFRDRLIFPILDREGRPLAIGGRRLADESTEPKYLNSPESPIYHKGQEWYGLHVSRAAIRQHQLAVVVEGYMDCVSLCQAGVEGVVASLGTSLTRAQVARLARDARRVVLAYDADTAGRAATQRAIEIWRQAGVRVAVAEWPAGDDPDSLARRDPTAAAECIRRATPAWEYLLHRALGNPDHYDLGGRLEAVSRVAHLLARVDETAEQEVLIQEAAARLGVSPSALEQEVAQLRPRQGMPQMGRGWSGPGADSHHTTKGTSLPAGAVAKAASGAAGDLGPAWERRRTETEGALLGWLLACPDPWPRWVAEIRPAWFHVPGYRRLWEMMAQAGTATGILAGQGGSELAGLAQWLRERMVGGSTQSGGGRSSPEVDELYGRELVWRVQTGFQIEEMATTERGLAAWEQNPPFQVARLNELLLRHKQVTVALVGAGTVGRGAQ